MPNFETLDREYTHINAEPNKFGNKMKYPCMIQKNSGKMRFCTFAWF